MARHRRAGSGKSRGSSFGNRPFPGRECPTEPQSSGPSGLSKPSDRGNLEQALDPGLYVVATPIGHASDITSRALRVLAGVDAIACEDTRVTAKLLAIHGISTSLTPYHDHNARAAGPDLGVEAAATFELITP